MEDVLRYQLVVCSKVTMATQTNWEWRVMAERWRRAPIVEAKTKPMDRNDAKAHLVQLKLKNILDGKICLLVMGGDVVGPPDAFVAHTNHVMSCKSAWSAPVAVVRGARTSHGGAGLSMASSNLVETR